jgi:hypothetical protein
LAYWYLSRLALALEQAIAEALTLANNLSAYAETKA